MKEVLLRSVPNGVGLHEYYDLLPDIVARFDRDFRHLFVNKIIESITGRKREEFLGKSNAELGMPRELVDLWHGMLEKILITKSKQEVEFEFPASDGNRYFHMVGNPEFDTNGEVLSIFIITRDNTEKKKLQEKLIVAVKQSSYESILREFTHHLNNPLAVVMARLELLEQKANANFTPAHLNQIQSIKKEVSRMRDLVSAMTRSSTAMGLLEIPKYSMMVSELIEAAIQLTEVSLGEQKQRIQIQSVNDYLIDSGCSELVETLAELLKNAMDSTHDRPAQAISVCTDIDGQNFHITVFDNGNEIPVGIREKIFDPFFTTKGPSHRGLGLSIVKSRIQRLGGEIYYRRENEMNQFQISLPKFFVSSAAEEAVVES